MAILNGTVRFSGAGGTLAPATSLRKAARIALAAVGVLGAATIATEVTRISLSGSSSGFQCVATVRQLDVDAANRGKFATAVRIVDSSGRDVNAATGGNLNVATTSTGANFIPFAAQPCKRIVIANNTGTAIEFLLGGAGVAFPIQTANVFTINGIVDASQVSVRRVDQGATPVTVNGHWEN